MNRHVILRVALRVFAVKQDQTIELDHLVSDVHQSDLGCGQHHSLCCVRAPSAACSWLIEVKVLNREDDLVLRSPGS